MKNQTLRFALGLLITACHGGGSTREPEGSPGVVGDGDGAQDAGVEVADAAEHADASAGDAGPEDDADAGPPAQSTVWTSVQVSGADGVEFHSISGSALDDVWAVGDSGDYHTAIIAHFDGREWSVIPQVESVGGIRAVWARGRDDVYAAVSAGGAVWRWDGHVWSVFADFGVTDTYALWGRGKELWLGTQWNFFTTPMHHYDGQMWVTENTPSQDGVLSIGGSASETWAVAHSQLLHWSGSAWVVDTSVQSSVSGVGGAGDVAWAVGPLGHVLRHDVQGWTQVASGSEQNLRHVWAPDPGHAIATGDAVLLWDGSAWKPADGPGAPSTGGAAWGLALDDLWMSSGADDGKLWHLHRTCGNGQQEGVEQCDGADYHGASCSSVLGKPASGALGCTDLCLFDTNRCESCGDGKANASEACDTTDFASHTCSSELGKPATGTLACTDTCEVDSRGCGLCGDGKVNGDEECDAGDLGGATCASALNRPATGSLACTADCKFATSDCSYCGDGVRGSGEICEGGDLGGYTCAKVFGGDASGVVSCSEACGLDLSACQPGTVPCGNMAGVQPGAPWPVAGRCPGHASRTDVIGPSRASKAWRVEGYFTSPPVIAADGTIYVSDYNWLYAFSHEGTLKWRYEGGSEAAAAIGADGTVYLAVDHVDDVGSTALDAVNPDGTRKWRHAHPELHRATPNIAADGTIYVAALGQLLAVHPDGSRAWTLDVDGIVTHVAIGRDGTLYFAASLSETGLGKLIAVKPDGTLRWSVDLDEQPAIGGAPALGPDGTLYVAADRLYAVRADGKIKWRSARRDFRSQPTMGVDGTLYLASYIDSHTPDKPIPTVTAVNPDSSTRWDFAIGEPLYETISIGGDGTLYASALWVDQLYAIRPDGTLLWSMPSGYSSSSVAIAADGMLVYVDNDLVAYKR